MEKVVNVIGAGLAGSEAAYQLAKRGIKVNLYEMRPVKMTPAHKTEGFAELICSNSLRGASLENAVGVLKEEMRMLGSLIMEAADATKVEAGGALAVDRDLFSSYVTNKLRAMENINIINEEVVSIPDGPTIIASGPLTSDDFHKSIEEYLGLGYMYFYDAIAPIVSERVYKSLTDKEKFKETLWDHKPLTDFWGIGNGIARRLARYGIHTKRSIAKCPEELMYRQFGINAELIIDHAWGKECCTMKDIKSYKSKSKSIFYELTTFVACRLGTGVIDLGIIKTFTYSHP